MNAGSVHGLVSLLPMRTGTLALAVAFQYSSHALSELRQHGPPGGGRPPPHIIGSHPILKPGPFHSGRWVCQGPWQGPGGLGAGAWPGPDGGSLTCVNVGVLLHVRLLVEALAAELAGVRPRVRVDEQVGGQRGRALEGLAAHPALEAALLPEETRRRGLRRGRGLAARDCQAGRRTRPGRNALGNRTLRWGGL